MAMTFTVKSAGGVASKVQMGRHELVFDQPRSAGGEGKGPGPLVAFAVALGGCAHYYATAYMKARELPGDVEVDVLMGKDPEASRLGQLDLALRLPPMDERHVKAIERAVRQCPVHGTLERPPEIGLQINSK